MADRQKSSDMLVVGRLTSVHGVRGWLKVFSYTEELAKLIEYQPWWIESPEGLSKVVVDDYKRQGDGLLVHLAGVDDRDDARAWCQRDVFVEKTLLPALQEDDYYWHQLVGLRVFLDNEADKILIGVVDSLLETGANDVLVVKGDSDSVDRKERLIPYSSEFVLQIDIVEQKMLVSWDLNF